jgi:hypothetical protein
LNQLREEMFPFHLVAREFHAFTFVFNGELEKPLHDPSRELASGFGFAFGRSFTRKVAAMIEHRLPARFSDDGGHFYAGGGFKVVIGR